MNGNSPRFVFVVSTSGSVMDAVLASSAVREVTHSAVFRGEVSGYEVAKKHGVRSTIIEAEDNESFCETLLEYIIGNQIDFILSFYTEFYDERFRRALRDRIINFHPSLLPAFKGMDGFGDGLRYHGKILGTTVELIKDVMDEGKIVAQSAFAADPTISAEQLRHRVFVQQCRTLIQVVDWFVQGRIVVEGDLVSVIDASYHDVEFVPALEHEDARSFSRPFPY